MTDRIVRIKSSRQGYRRGGQDFGSSWTEVDTSELTRDQQRAILADGVLTIEGREADGSWTPLTDEIRGGLLSVVQDVDGFEAEGEERAVEVDPAILAKAASWDDLLAQVSLSRPDLEALNLWPVDHVDELLSSLIEAQVQSKAVVADRDASILTLKADLEEADALLAAANADIEALKAGTAQPNTTRDVQPDGGDADPSPAEPTPKPKAKPPAKESAAK
ncbi:hypothetical protein [Brevundimonas sp.]|uniref:hypothetical protein n=1 Tax=Brevundimonas sp. TaxID=1871086 RepID=UPI003F70A4FB